METAAKYEAFFSGKCSTVDLPLVKTSELQDGAKLTGRFWRHYLNVQEQMDEGKIRQDGLMIVNLVYHYVELKAKYGEEL